MGEVEALAVVGPGLIGTSVVLAAKRKWPAIQTRTIDVSERLDFIRRADVVVLATPVGVTIELLPQVGALVDPAALVLDTGSTKRVILQTAKAAGVKAFIGGHPMAGGTTPGPAEARANLFENAPWFLMNPDAPPGTIERAAKFVEGLGARAIRLNDRGEYHDHLVAAISHLPQVTVSALMTIVGGAVRREDLQYSGRGLRDTTRLANSSASMWASILATNRDEVRALLKELVARLDAIADRLDDPAAIKELFDAATRFKSTCL
ncbi:MAG: prephenate dehydrogenase [Vicinamibacterales bacterium]